MNPLRIAFLCNEYPPGAHGGIGTYTRNLSRWLVRAGHEVRIFGCYKGIGPGDEIEDDQGVQVFRMPNPQGPCNWIRLRWRLFQRAKQWSDRGEIDLIEIPDWQGWGAAWPRLSVPVLIRLHGSATYFNLEAGNPTDCMTKWLESNSLKRADACASVSSYTASRTADAFKFTPALSKTLYNSVALKNNHPISARSRNDIVFSGTLTKKKGVTSLIQAWNRVVGTFPDARLHLYGKDGFICPEQSMQVFLSGLLSDSTRPTAIFHGHQANETLLGSLAKARAAVFPSYAEAFALAPLEAMACGCPTIYTERGSGRELMQDGVHGLLIDPDNIDQLADALMRLLSDDGLAGRLGNAGWTTIKERFCPAIVVPENEQFFRLCIERFKQDL